LNQFGCEFFEMLIRVSFSKPVLQSDVFSFNPAKLAQLLPKRIDKDRHPRSSAWIQESYAEYSSWLLRLKMKSS